MCFGNNTQKTQTTTTNPSPVLQGGAATSIGAAENAVNRGFTPYGGSQVAPFSPLQQGSFGLASALAGSGVPNVAPAGALINAYANAPQGSVTPSPISSAMSPYLNQYVGYALAPQLQAAQNQQALQSQLTQGAATSAGAFGDPRATMLQQNQNFLGGLQQQGVVGNAYNTAFNAAIGAGGQDIANSLGAQTTNQNLREQALSRALGGAAALQNLGTYQVGTGTQLANLANQYGAQQTAQNQAQLNAAYQQWLMGQQYPFQAIQALNQSLTSSANALPQSSTQVTTAPDNSGYGILGSIGGSILGGPIGGQIGRQIGNQLSGNSDVLNPPGTNAVIPGMNAPLGNYQYAEGGEPPVGKLSVVGEEGPEVFIPRDRDAQPVLVGQGGPETIIPKESGTIVPNEHVEGIARALRLASPMLTPTNAVSPSSYGQPASDASARGGTIPAAGLPAPPAAPAPPPSGGNAKAPGVAPLAPYPLPPLSAYAPPDDGGGVPSGWMRALGLDPARARIALGAVGQGLSAGAQPGMSRWASFAKGLGGALQGGAATQQQLEQESLAQQKQKLALAQSAREQQGQDFYQQMAAGNANRAQQALDDLNRYRRAMLTLQTQVSKPQRGPAGPQPAT